MKISKNYFLFVNELRDHGLNHIAYVKVKPMTIIAQRMGRKN